MRRAEPVQDPRFDLPAQLLLAQRTGATEGFESERRRLHATDKERHPARRADVTGLKHAIFLVDRSEKVGEPSNALGHAKEEKTAGAKRVMENRQDVPLGFGSEIDQQVAAGDQ
jgi:hypothetical protein